MSEMASCARAALKRMLENADDNEVKRMHKRGGREWTWVDTGGIAQADTVRGREVERHVCPDRRRCE